MSQVDTPAASSESTPNTVENARRGLIAYLTLVALSSGLVEWLIYRTHRPLDDLGAGPTFLLMWMPGLSALVVRLARREGFRDISLRLGGRPARRTFRIAIVYPLLVGGLAYGIAWSTGLATFVPPTRTAIGLASPMARFAARLGLNGGIGLAFGLPFALGEELGWRGYMLTRLIDSRLPRPVLLSGIIWASWHLPLILTGQYASGARPWLSGVIFFVDVIAAAYLFAYLRLVSGSVWPAVLAHAAWNAVIQSVFDRSTHHPGIWVGESGLLVAGASVVIVVLLVRGTFKARRAPTDETLGALSLAAL